MSRNYEIKFRCIRTSYNTCVGFTLCDVGEYKGYCMDDGFKMWLEQDKIHLNGEQYIISSINYEKPTGLSRYKFYMMVDYIAFEYARMPVEIT